MFVVLMHLKGGLQMVMIQMMTVILTTMMNVTFVMVTIRLVQTVQVSQMVII